MKELNLKKMSAKEKMILIEEIWETMDEPGHSLESPNWHKTEIQKRVESINNGTAKYITLNELKGIE